MKRSTLFLILLATLLGAQAQRPANAQTQIDIFYANFSDVLECVNEEADGAEKAHYYAMKDLDNDGKIELVVADVNKLKTVFNVVDGEVHIISPGYNIDNESLDWNLVENFYCYTDVDRSADVTLRHHPVFAYDVDIAANRFTVPGDVTWDDNVMRSTRYDRMVFKPHVGNISFVKAEQGSYLSDGNPIDLGMCYTYRLDDAAMTKKMFRGYSNDYAVPIIVPSAWLADHNPLQFSRYLYGETEPKVTPDTRRLIEQYYGGLDRIHSVKWIATCQENERSFYEVIFRPRNGKVLLAFVCIAEAQVVSTRNMWFDKTTDDDSVDIGPDIDDLMWFSPEILVMAAAPAGLELYVRWHSLEGVHYDIWREVADQWMVIAGNYHYTMAY